MLQGALTNFQGELRQDMLRQWKIIQTLLTSSGKSAAEVAPELEIHPRTV
jgi:predicted ArsR family transcriptional regulator